MDQSPFLRSQNFFSLSRNSPPFMQLEGSLPLSKKPAVCPHPKPYQSTPCHTFNLLKSHNFRTTPRFFPNGLFPPRLPHQTLHTTPSSSSHLLLVSPDSLFLISSPELYLVRSTNYEAPHYAVSS